jgi:benzoate-CoA ligase family protein
LGNSLTFPMSVGAATVFLADRPTPDAVLGMMQQHNPTLFGGVPTLYAALLANPYIGPGAGSARLRRCISAGEALPADIGTRWKSIVGVDILDGIGSTELLHIFISNTPGDIRYGTSGKPVPGYEARIIDDHERPARNGEAGELVVRGDSAAEGYWNQRGKSRRTFQGEWTYTGDTYIRDEDGYYRFQGRSDEMLKVSGVWVSPFEVEEALISHPAVLEAAVIGREDADGLVKPEAWIVPKVPVEEVPEGLDADLVRHCRTRLAPYKFPRWVQVVPDLPKTATGKIQRFLLRQRHMAVTPG